jgi:hypothetical protein
MSVTLSPIASTEARLVQESKAPLPMTVTLFPISTERTLVQNWKAALPMDTILSGITNVVRLKHGTH